MTTIYNDIINGGIPLEAYGYIYCIINKINGKTYIGKHKVYAHECDDGSVSVESWRTYMGSGTNIRIAINKYGVENFDKILLDWSYYDDILAWKEVQYIQKYKDMGQAEYNIVVIYQSDDRRAPKDRKSVEPKIHEQCENKYLMFKHDNENEIMETYKRLTSVRKTAESLGFGYHMVSRVLHDNNVELGIANRKKQKSDNRILIYSDKNKCRLCGRKLNNSNSHMCPQCIQKHNDKINKAKSNARKIFEMHENGKSLRELERIYEVSDITILNIIKPFAEASNEKKSIGNYGAHLRWHVRKHMKSSDCDYCNDNIGFTDENMVKPEERVHQCFNPDCDNTVIGIANYCSNACREKMIKYLSLFSSHKVAHINKDKYSEYCFYCVHNIDDSKWMHDHNNMRILVDECDRLNIKRHDDVMKTYESNGTIEGTSKLTCVSFPVVKSIVNGLK